MRETIKKIRNIIELTVGGFAMAWFALCLVSLCSKLIIQSYAHMEKTSAVIQGEFFIIGGIAIFLFIYFILMAINMVERLFLVIMK